MTLLARIPRTPAEVESLRLIRNDVRTYMTRHKDPVTPEGQADWWARPDKGMIYLFSSFNEKGLIFPVGYGIIRRIAPGIQRWLTGGIVAAFRGHGYGRQLFQFLVDTTTFFGYDPWLEVLKTNERALGLYKGLSFVEVPGKESEGGVLTMRYSP